MYQEFKTIKDSVHGYISIEKEYIDKFINTPLFQRLGRIEQTSMRVLYPSARHDRFIHSIGTFHLGKRAFLAFKENFEKEFTEELEWEVLQRSFEVACLLHDVGHAPFSHTCENFYEEEKVDVSNYDNKAKIFQIDAMLFDKLESILEPLDYSEIKVDYGLDSNIYNSDVSPSPHEKLSCLVILEKYIDVINELGLDINLIIRSIIGCTFIKTLKDKGVKNAIIRMLNSPVIDVDKLDYITRDTSLTGFANATIDIDRLLICFTADKDTDGDYYPAYYKNALSIIQNVISASNLQQAWIVNHHTVVYNSYLIKTSINKVCEIMSSKKFPHVKRDLFSLDAIIGNKRLTNNFSVSMLSDDDLLHLFKLHFDKVSEIQQLLDRTKRKKAVWKSFAEFTMLFNAKQTAFNFDFFSKVFTAFCDDFESHGSKLFSEYNTLKGNLSLATYVLYDILDEFSKLKGIDINEFVLLSGGSPSKNKAIISRDKLKIKFDVKQRSYEYNEIMKLVPIEKIDSSLDSNIKPFFYIYHKNKIDKYELSDYIIKHPSLQEKKARA